MKPETLKSIKNELKKLLPVIESYQKCFSRVNLITAGVIVNNMAFDNTNVTNYSHSDDCKELADYQECLRNMANYNENDHFIKWIYEEVLWIITGNVMSEDEN